MVEYTENNSKEIKKTCETCRENDYGLCDRKGFLVEDDDTCEKWKDKNPNN